ncbi:4-(cytidine 5'-diphospho)-2-C-methyl-D-erythritol kinase [Rhizobium sp. CFBP 8762]|uniref:4-(cytidine 5'-diphospho)-2-C-methyl-D-erythritol kinase n=1 Tax=Rhizobium sp. CFBP 8762 TaxID=2775279 RepID=UPI00177BC4FE|nr:4-(cytidine 5'-diphospho)-2-C-methyl-D-erythritol kinase [Rhizobium sp. CFBP 8762]MBD8553308.1 4-(cytidine 5'-diphospho)-2-C-methyl-D-erythritol kinase [Rhizobium sp. CFBP 8762]
MKNTARTGPSFSRDAARHTLTLFAPAKINLSLHVTGQRADGYHLLDSIVVFADNAGDRISASLENTDQFTLSGPFAEGLEVDAGNLVLKARDTLRSALNARDLPCPPVHIHLEKNLPIASGIGGGSADAAATLKVLTSLWNSGLPDPQLALSLGADVPMCLISQPLLARGIGEDVQLIKEFPAVSLVLVNPMKSVSTPAIFTALTNKTNPPIGSDLSDWLKALHSQRNDLQPPAEICVPEIATACAALMDFGAQLARMSGSGATCFGIFPSIHAARKAESQLVDRYPQWYVTATTTGASFDHIHQA